MSLKEPLRFSQRTLTTITWPCDNIPNRKTGHQVCTDEMIGPQEQLCGPLTIIELTKVYRFLLWKFIHFERGFLEVVLERFLCWWHLIVREQARLSDGLANQSLESKWTVGERLASDQRAVWKLMLILCKGQWTVLQCLVGKCIHIEKILS